MIDLPYLNRIPRATVESIAKTVNGILDKHFPGSIMTICGSYRCDFTLSFSSFGLIIIAIVVVDVGS